MRPSYKYLKRTTLNVGLVGETPPAEAYGITEMPLARMTLAEVERCFLSAIRRARMADLPALVAVEEKNGRVKPISYQEVVTYSYSANWDPIQANDLARRLLWEQDREPLPPSLGRKVMKMAGGERNGWSVDPNPNSPFSTLTVSFGVAAHIWLWISSKLQEAT
jgi:hypothetical protein